MLRPRRNCGGGGIEKGHSAHIQVFIQTPDCYPEIWKASRSPGASTTHPTTLPFTRPQASKSLFQELPPPRTSHPTSCPPTLLGLPQRQTLQTRRIIFGRSLSAFLSLTYIYIYMYMCVRVYVCACVCVYMETGMGVFWGGWCTGGYSNSSVCMCFFFLLFLL